MTASEPNHNPRGTPISVSGRSASVFGDSSGDKFGIPSDKPTKDPYPVPIIKPYIMPSETPTRNHSCVTREFMCVNLTNMLIEYPSGDPTGAPSIMPN